MPRLILSAELLAAIILLGVPGVYIASVKGRSMLEGFIFGAFLGPIGWLIEALLPTKRKD
jgi:hypothetical protein